MSRAKKEKYLLYLVLMIVLIAAASFQHFISNGTVSYTHLTLPTILLV